MDFVCKLVLLHFFFYSMYEYKIVIFGIYFRKMELKFIILMIDLLVNHTIVTARLRRLASCG